jgi:hypothetical protein
MTKWDAAILNWGSMTLEEYRKLEQKKNRGKTASSEHAMQAGCVRWFRAAFPEHAHLLFAIPNAGRRSAWERMQVLEEGLLAGVPDLFLAVPRNGYHGLWMELKNGKAGRLTESQKRMITNLRNQDYAVEVIHSFEEFHKTIKEYLV